MIEKIKTVILIILVISSLLLTFALWTYQPQYEELGEPTYLEETRLDGETREIAELIHPTQIIFHNGQEHSQKRTQRGMEEVYQEIREWSFSSISPYVSDAEALADRRIEITFATELPLEMIDQVFEVTKPDRFWNQTFNRVYFQLSQTSEDHVNVTFTSDNYDGFLTGEIESSSVYDQIEEWLNDTNNMYLTEFTFNDHLTRYLPAESMNVQSYTLLTENILNVQPLINNLFNNPTLVRRQSVSIDEDNYTDGSRALTTSRVLESARAMEFINPITSEIQAMTPTDLIRRSVDFMNDHSGWTDEFYLDEVNDQANVVEYRMYYNDLPLFDMREHTLIHQAWRDQQIYQFNRPLFQTGATFHTEEQTKSVSSGSSIYNFFINHDEDIPLRALQDIRLGYAVEPHPEASNAIYLEPNWHIKYNDRWYPLSYFENMVQTRSDD